MKRVEFMDLLRYYLSELPKTVVDEILEEYNLHFQEGMAHGKTEEEISEDLGSPKIIAHEYLNYESRKQGASSSKTSKRSNGFFRDSAGNLNWALILLLIVLSPFWGSIVIAIGATIFAAIVTVVAVGISAIGIGVAVLVATLFPFLPFLDVGPGFTMLSPVTRTLSSLTALVLGVIVIKLMINLIVFLGGKIRDKYRTYKWKRSREWKSLKI